MTVSPPDAARRSVALPADGLPVLTTLRPRLPVDVVPTLGSLRRGRADPSHWVDGGAVWRAGGTPAGSVTVRLATRSADREVSVAAWGPGAEWAVAAAPDLVGGRDDLEGWAPEHPLLRELSRRHPGVRVPRSGRVLEALVPAFIEQKVTGVEARRSWRELLLRHGSPAPYSPPGWSLRVMPEPAVLAALPSWEWHLAGVDRKRWAPVRHAAQLATTVESAAARPLSEAHRLLRALPGVGPWTDAEVAQRALGDPDAVSVGDYHLASFVGWALTGAPVDDAGMLGLLSAVPGHRYRAIRLLEVGCRRPPRRAPRMPVRDYRSF